MNGSVPLAQRGMEFAKPYSRFLVAARAMNIGVRQSHAMSFLSTQACRCALRRASTDC
jgi:hypothetical protein